MRALLLTLLFSAVAMWHPLSQQIPSTPTSSTVRVHSTTVGDTLLVVASWNAACDGKGCPDSTRVRWMKGSQGSVLIRHTVSTRDTLRVPNFQYGDTLRINVQVAQIRRGIASTSRSATRTIRRQDTPPPPPSTVSLDTAWAALVDSFPLIVARDSLGYRSGSVRQGQSRQLCALSRNRYTGVYHVLVEPGTPPDVANRLLVYCDHARAQYAAERDG